MHLGVSPDAIYKWLPRKHMPAHKVGRLWKFLMSEVDAWVKAGRAAQRTVPKRTTPNKPSARVSHRQSEQ